MNINTNATNDKIENFLTLSFGNKKNIKFKIALKVEFIKHNDCYEIIAKKINLSFVTEDLDLEKGKDNFADIATVIIKDWIKNNTIAENLILYNFKQINTKININNELKINKERIEINPWINCGNEKFSVNYISN